MDWPPQSVNLNIIEAVLDDLNTEWHKRQHPKKNTDLQAC